jgi:hypothetical protein
MDQNTQLAKLRSEEEKPVPTMLEIIQSKEPAIKVLSFEDYAKTVQAIEDAIVDTQIMLSTTKEINDFQLKAVSRLIISDYGSLCLSDLRRCLNEGVKGAYGEIYRFDVNTVCTWLNKYSGEKDGLVSSLPKLTPEQAEVLKMVNETKVKEPATAQDIVRAKGMPENVRTGLTKLFKKHGIKDPLTNEKFKDAEYKWPQGKDEFETECLTVFKERWEDQGKKELTGKKPTMLYNEIMFNPDNWLTYCYKLKLQTPD